MVKKKTEEYVGFHPFILISRIAGEGPAEYDKRRFEEFSALKNRYPGAIEDPNEMPGGVLLWHNGRYVGYASNHGLVAEKKNPKRK